MQALRPSTSLSPLFNFQRLLLRPTCLRSSHKTLVPLHTNSFTHKIATTNNKLNYPTGHRAMATSSEQAQGPILEWLVIAPDHENALEKRLAVRPTHLAGLKEDPETFWLWGGAMLKSQPKEGEAPSMLGSAMLIGARSEEEVLERLKKDVYVTGEVWDWEKVKIIPFKSALRKPL
ncbi:hypothetical protein P154DRAFT_524732 [Amniculicola lignicola CBS 123094]|uniref:YCII-related domain-containing protein n=1 Tax=Amniculicola lignicola CBS 123094 TaxID=1392246 RepID=A0A6A5W8R9_9PLEO|nr:hypothetical protein P154DRAFT_524732 [Amniculicola lignicola CBS 123094]